MAEWDAEIVVSSSEVAEIVGKKYAEFRHSHVTEYAAGWDNTAFLVNDAVLFRFPRRSISIDLLTREITLLPQICTFLSLPISSPQYHGLWGNDPKLPFAGYRMLVGRPASLSDFDDYGRTRMAVPLALFLRELHSIDTTPLFESGLPADLFGRFNAEKLLPRMLARAAVARDAGYEIPSTLIDWVQAHPPSLDQQLSLVHGDLYARHLLIDAGGLPSGVIDWGDMHAGTPAIDLAAAFTMLPPQAHATFLEAYGPVTDAVWRAARWRGIYSALLCLEFGIKSNAEDMRRCGSVAVDLIARGL